MQFIPFFALFISLFNIRDKCIAPLKMPPQPPSSYKRIMSIILTRHGSRTPVYYYPNAFSITDNINDKIRWNCSFDIAYLSKIGLIHKKIDPNLIEYPPSCTAGQLTKEGFDQHYNLGFAFRNYLDETKSIFGNYIDQNDIYIRTTTIERAYRSALSFMQGFEPPVFPDESIEIISGSESFDMLRPNKRQCKEMADIYKNFTKSKKFHDHLINSYEIMKDVFDFLQIKIKSPKSIYKKDYELNKSSSNNDAKLLEDDQSLTDSNKRPKITTKSNDKIRDSKHKKVRNNQSINKSSSKKSFKSKSSQFNEDSYFEDLAEAHKGACDFVITHDCFESSEFVFPNVSSTKRAEIIKHCEDLTNTSVSMRIISFSQAFRAIFKLIDDRISMNNHFKMALFSAHDSSVTEMLNALGQDVKYNPPYASYIITELLQKGAQYYIRFSFNGEVIMVPKELAGDECGTDKSGIYSFHEFRMNFQPRIDHCRDFDEL